MLKGFADLVFEHEGRYWVLDYKSNCARRRRRRLHARRAGGRDGRHRYDVQGAIYLLALHRLLRSRLGEAYDPARQLGGAIYLFLRGINAARAAATRLPPLAMLDRARCAARTRLLDAHGATMS